MDEVTGVTELPPFPWLNKNEMATNADHRENNANNAAGANVTMKRFAILGTVLLLAVALFSGGCSTPREDLQKAPPFKLIDQDGKVVEIGKPTGRTAIITFLYTSCTTTCPAYINKISLAMTRLDPVRREEVDVLAVTVDPDRDTPERLKAFTANLPSYWHFLTETRGRLKDVWDNYDILVRREDDNPAIHHEHHGYQVIHTAKAVVVDGRGYIRAELQGDWETGDLVLALEVADDRGGALTGGAIWASIQQLILRYTALCERVGSISWLGAALSLLKQFLIVATAGVAIYFLWRPQRHKA